MLFFLKHTDIFLPKNSFRFHKMIFSKKKIKCGNQIFYIFWFCVLQVFIFSHIRFQSTHYFSFRLCGNKQKINIIQSEAYPIVYIKKYVDFLEALSSSFTREALTGLTVKVDLTHLKHICLSRDSNLAFLSSIQCPNHQTSRCVKKNTLHLILKDMGDVLSVPLRENQLRIAK